MKIIIGSIGNLDYEWNFRNWAILGSYLHREVSLK